VGGNHEASNYLREIQLGGWVAPNIYYLGSSGVVQIKKQNFKLRVGGISGIFNFFDFNQSVNEHLPIQYSNQKSIFHQKQIEILKLALIKQAHMDVFLSHDWPNGIYQYGDCERLLRMKPFFEKDIQ